jgi:hypothetical protein
MVLGVKILATLGSIDDENSQPGVKGVTPTNTKGLVSTVVGLGVTVSQVRYCKDHQQLQERLRTKCCQSVKQASNTPWGDLTTALQAYMAQHRPLFSKPVAAD